MSKLYRGVAVLTALALLAVARSSSQAQAGAGRIKAPPGGDSTCAPCRDFYRFVNGVWLDTATIPSTSMITGVAYYTLDNTLHRVNDILAEAAANRGNAVGSRGQKIGDFYGSCMDSSRAESDGTRPVAAVLSAIDAASSSTAIAVAAARLERTGTPVLFSISVGPDQRNGKKMVLMLAQGGLGLPDRDYYLRDDPRMAGIRDAYVASVAKRLELAGSSPSEAADAAKRVMALETEMARSSMTLVARRNVEATYHKLSATQVAALAPEIPWGRVFAEWNLNAPDSLVVRQPEYLAALSDMLKRMPPSDWRAYLRWHELLVASPYLSNAFADEAFRLNQRLSGASRQAPRWERCTNAANQIIGELVGHAYVDKYFPPSAKAKGIQTVVNLRDVLADRIRTLDWMTSETKKEALAKVASLRIQVGYPDTWKDYSPLVVDRGSFVGNVLRARAFEFGRQMKMVGQRPPAGEWMSGVPQVFDGLAGPLNTITFTAAAFQEPWYDPNGDDAANYGALGMVIGHEMTHHFDDNGRHYDASGNLRDWWTPEDAARYNQRAQLLVEQFDQYTELDQRLNGKLLLGENLADLGGVKVAYLAMEKALTGKPRRIIDGYTPEQRFFIAFAHWQASKSRPEYVRQRLATNGHAPDEFRVNGPVSDMPEFAAAFHCKAGDALVRPANLRPQIW